MSDEMTVAFTGGKKVSVSYNQFEIVTDQSFKNGGQGTAPEPFDLFLASLASCAGVYVLGFCEKRGISTEGVRLVQRWQRNDKGRITTVSIHIEVPEEFPDKYRDALVRVANQCTVKKTIEDPPEFVVQAVSRELQPA